MSLGILCPGQGDQTPALFDLLPPGGAGERLLAVAREVLGQDPRALPAEALHRNAVAQPLVAAAQLATWEPLRARLPAVGAFAGYSLGELVAWGCAGALRGEDVIRLAARRAAAMDAALRAPPRVHPMALRAVRGLSRDEVSRRCAPHGVEVAIVNGADRLVVGGPVDGLDAAEAELSARGAKVTPLRVEVPSHTSWLAAAVTPFRAALAAVPFGLASAPVLAGLDGTPVFEQGRAVEVLARQLAEPLEWAACLDGLVERGCTALLELGPGSGLARMARDRFPELPARAVEEFRSLEGAAAWAVRAAEPGR